MILGETFLLHVENVTEFLLRPLKLNGYFNKIFNNWNYENSPLGCPKFLLLKFNGWILSLSKPRPFGLRSRGFGTLVSSLGKESLVFNSLITKLESDFSVLTPNVGELKALILFRDEAGTDVETVSCGMAVIVNIDGVVRLVPLDTTDVLAIN